MERVAATDVVQWSRRGIKKKRTAASVPIQDGGERLDLADASVSTNITSNVCNITSNVATTNKRRKKDKPKPLTMVDPTLMDEYNFNSSSDGEDENSFAELMLRHEVNDTSAVNDDSSDEDFAYGEY